MHVLSISVRFVECPGLLLPRRPPNRFSPTKKPPKKKRLDDAHGTPPNQITPLHPEAVTVDTTSSISTCRRDEAASCRRSSPHHGTVHLKTLARAKIEK
mmetsp:Transcript_11656/g.25226  ORF Transcript_11656/g.25226 Transcript_11656/m.25226 type:complete len:99 (+) Transcript_11656:263-559(+)